MKKPVETILYSTAGVAAMALILIAFKNMKPPSKNLYEYELSIGGRRRSNLEKITLKLCLA